MAEFNQNHFALFGLPEQFALDSTSLDQNYRRLQSEVHPDRFASASPHERLHSLQIATQVNDAYATLKNPTARARYLLQLQGVDTQEESNTAMPADFLMLQMEWREAIAEASEAEDIPALEHLLKTIRLEAKALQEKLHLALDENKALHEASAAVRKLAFIDKVRADIEQAIIKLEG
ncbi:MAG: Fe-S protein assembly co-chaperone HscB [Methylophilaceae bacterium]